MIDKLEEVVLRTPGLNNLDTYVLKHNRFNSYMFNSFNSFNSFNFY